MRVTKERTADDVVVRSEKIDEAAIVEKINTAFEQDEDSYKIRLGGDGDTAAFVEREFVPLPSSMLSAYGDESGAIVDAVKDSGHCGEREHVTYAQVQMYADEQYTLVDEIEVSEF